MLNTRIFNEYLGSAYGLEEVAAKDPLEMIIMLALKRGMSPPQKRGKE